MVHFLPMEILLNEGMNYCTVRPIKSQNPSPGIKGESTLPIIWKILMDVNSDLFTCFFLDLYWISALIMQVTCRIQLTCRENSDSQEKFIQPSIIISFSFDKPIRNLNVSYMLIYIRFTWILKLSNKNHETSTCFLAVSCR